MNTKTKNFLNEILGSKGRIAIENLQKKSPDFVDMIIPRTLLSWIATICKLNKFEGAIPGNTNTQIVFNKNEDNSFSGQISINNELYKFENKAPLHIASIVSIGLELDLNNFEFPLNKSEISDLGSKIDTLIKTHFINEYKSKKLLKSIKITKNELDKKCQMCGKNEFVDQEFVGCLCFRSMSKSIKTEATLNGFNLYFSKNWDSEAIETFIKIIKK
ncbi:MAG: hypothetical protein KGO96_07305 [Elusimicrobia bacterium]|nr:hypothetical protein [Elusimicrobiota bacterium]